MNEKELLAEISRLRIRIAEMESLSSGTQSPGDLDLRGEGILYLTDALPVTIAYVDAKGRYIFNNRNYREWFGLTGGDLYGKRIEDVLGQEAFEAVEPFVKEALAGKTVNHERQVIFRDGSLHHINASYVPHLGKGGEVRGFFSLGVDVSERRSAEKELILSQERYKTLVEESFDGIFIQKGSRIVFANRAFCEMMGYAADELRGMEHWLVYDPEFQSLTRERAMARMRGEDVPSRYEVKLKRKDGSTFDGEIRAKVIKIESTLGVQVWVRDVTEIRHAEADREKLEDQLRKAQKLEAIGTLAGGIAHDFNNLLMVIMGNISLLIMEAQPEGALHERLKVMEKAAKSGSDLTRQLLGFARGGRYEVRPADLNELVRDTYAVFGRTRKEIRPHENYAADLWLADVDRGQMEQVLLNLFLNAWQAMPDGGDIYLETKNRLLDDRYASLHGGKPGRYVQLTVTDTGEGMDKRILDRIFEPFFTTKERGRGTGLGLAMVYGVIKGHRGIINVYSEKGHGTSFSVYLPASRNQEIIEEQSTAQIEMGNGTLLLVDDEEMILDVGGSLLESLGYETIRAQGGIKAVEIYSRMHERIDLVILDMIMPDMGGKETFERLRKINPKAKVLLASGYSLNGQAGDILERGCDGFIQKPFTLEGLSRKINSLLKDGP